MKLLWFNLAMDLDDPALAFTSDWVNAVAGQVERVTVITMRRGRVEVPDNVRVYSLGKELGFGEPRRLLRFYQFLGQQLRRDRPHACFSHMAPIFTSLAGPLLKATGIPILTWYTHPSLTPTLRVAHWLSDAMVTSLPTSYPHRRDKVIVLGHGIDTTRFSPAPLLRFDEPPLILSVGRLSPVKDQSTLIAAIAHVRERTSRPMRAAIVGTPLTARDHTYTRALHAQVQNLGLDGVISFPGAVTREHLPSWYREATVHVNLTPIGFGDKAALESLACGTPTITANDGFRDTLGIYADDFLFPSGDVKKLASRIEWSLALDPETRATIGAKLREEVVQRHGLSSLATRLVATLQRMAH